MTSKNLFFNLMREDLKRRLWAAALTFLTFFFTLPVASAMAVSESRRLTENSYLELLYRFRSILGLDNGFMAVFTVVLSLILGIAGFSWLHSRKKVDFYHSLPVSRVKLFFVNYLDGILILFLTYAVNLLMGLLIAAANGIALRDIVPAALETFGFLMLHFIMLYSMTVLAMVLTGHIMVGILGTCVFYFYFPVLITVLNAYYRAFFRTGYDRGSSLASLLIDKCSAFTLYIGNYGAVLDGAPGRSVALRILAAALVTVGTTLASLLLYRLRGSEAAGKALAFKVSRPIIRIPVVILSALGGGLFFWYLHDSLGWAVFGIICGLLLSHCTIEIICYFDFKKLFSGRISMAVCGAAALLIFCGFRFDLFGYDRYIPKQSSVESAAISLFDMDSWVDYGYAGTDGGGEYFWNHENADQYLLSHAQISDTGTVLSLAAEAVKQTVKEKNGLSVWDGEDRDHFVRFSVRFTLKSGREIYRSYVVSGDTSYGLIKKLYDSRDYRLAAYPVLKQTPAETGKIKVTQDDWTREITRGKSRDGADLVDLLLRTYQEELTGLTAEVKDEEKPVARIQFMTTEQAAAEAGKYKDGYSWNTENLISRGFYPVYPTFTKTAALLKECGVELNMEAGDEEDGGALP